MLDSDLMKTDLYPSRVGRASLWVGANVLILFAIAITNGLLVFFVGAVSSCLFSVWMCTAFLVRFRRGKPLTPFLKVVLVAVGILPPMAFASANPFYTAVILGVVIHGMRILNRYDLGPISAMCAAAVSVLPLVSASHIVDSQLVFYPEWAAFEPIIGHLVVVILFGAGILLIKNDDWNLLPLVGKTEEKFGFETVGVPRWVLRRYPSLRGWR